ncbi:MAG: septal ring lytic transglycosylase RlpA family protein [Nitrospirae bacterium]|nr:septal ring lytic transglycosylase RlpA family protein [Nitrospirota bacterium]
MSRGRSSSDLRLMFLHITLYTLLITILVSCSSSRQAVRQKPVQQDLPVGSVEAVASWYGSDFHGRPTSSGQIFDMYLHTCAHKQYPFGTRLKVTLKSNNRSVECIVNDRGPFIEGRDIDLSYASAKEINLIGPGTAPVLIEIQGRDASYIKPVRVQSSDRKGSPFAVQIGSFTDSINAVRLKVGLRLKEVNAYIQETEVRGITYYRVRVGNFDQFSQAMDMAEQLGQEGYPALIVKADLKI